MVKNSNNRKSTKRKVFFLTVMVIAMMGYIYAASKTPLLPGYHQFFYTPKKYSALKSQLKHQDLIYDFKKLLPFWLGTRYSFHGNTTIPGEGKIACGYFVTTMLADLGFKIDRARLAQLPSEEMIKEITSKQNIQRFSGISTFDLKNNVINTGRGLYILGLDTHTGFVLSDESGVWFIHSSGSFPLCVVKEKLIESKVVNKSKYRVLGKLTSFSN